MAICLERGAGLHTGQLMPLPLTVSCFSKIQICFTFWYRLTRVVPDKGPLNGCVCVCVCVCACPLMMGKSIWIDSPGRIKSKHSLQSAVSYSYRLMMNIDSKLSLYTIANRFLVLLSFSVFLASSAKHKCNTKLQLQNHNHKIVTTTCDLWPHDNNG